jgi:hypothetical protein
VFYGRIVLTYNPANPDLPDLLEQPDWRFIEITHQEHIRRKEHLLGVKDHQTFGAFIPGHVNFLSDAIIALFLRGRTEDAQKYFKYVHDTYKKNELDWNLPLHDYVWRQVRMEGRGTRQTAHTLVMSLIQNAFELGLMGYRDEMELAMGTAAQLHKEFNNQATTRNEMPSLVQMQAEGAYSMLMSLHGSVAMELYAMLSVPVQRAIYDPLGTFMRDRCKQQNLDFDKAFPEPEGMELYRQRRQQWIDQNAQPRQKMAGEDKEEQGQE